MKAADIPNGDDRSGFPSGTGQAARVAGSWRSWAAHCLVACLIGGAPVRAAPDVPTDGQLTRPHALIAFHGVPPAFAEAIATLVESDWLLLHEDFGFALPEVVRFSIDVRRGNRAAIWIDEHDGVQMTLRSVSQLKRPSRSRVNTIYGICAVMAELAARRTLGAAPWMNDATKQGLYSYCAAESIDRVYTLRGASFWPDRHAYRKEGLRDLKKRLKRRTAPPPIEAAGLWLELTRLLGKDALGKSLSAWATASAGPSHSESELRKALAATFQGRDRTQVLAWFERFRKTAFAKADKKPGAAFELKPNLLSKSPVLLRYDDDGSEGRECLKQDGQIVFFESPPGRWFITRIDVFAERFGVPLRRMEEVTMTLCDENLRPVKVWRRPYGTFRGARPRWFHLHLPPTQVPSRFAISLQFYCTPDKGVRVHRDDSQAGHSAVGQPGGDAHRLDRGNWMIRVALDTSKTDNPLLWRP